MKKRTMLPLILTGLIAVTAFLGFKAFTTVRAAAEVPSVKIKYAYHGGTGSSQALADALGITLDELSTAQENARLAAIDEALAQGLITQAQADALKIKSGGMPFGRGHDGWFGLDRIDFNSLLAEELGITVGELSAAQVKAQDAQIDQAVTDGRITQEQADLMKGRRALAANEGFLSAMKSAYTEAVNKALAAGVITQAQADALLNDLETNGLFFKNGRHGLGGMEGFGRHGHGGSGFMGSGSDVPFQETTPPASSEDTSTSL